MGQRLPLRLPSAHSGPGGASGGGRGQLPTDDKLESPKLEG